MVSVSVSVKVRCQELCALLAIAPTLRCATGGARIRIHTFALLLVCYGTVAQQPIAVKPYFSLSLPVRLWFGH